MSLTVAVAGLGAIGAAAAWQCARRGLRVLGFDRFRPPHPHGSSHGLTRVIRETAFEHPRYVPLVRRAYALWEELERETGARLLTRTGALYVGAPESSIVAGSRASALAHGVATEELSAEAIQARWPVFAPATGMVGLLEHRGAILHPEACVTAFLESAARRGVELHYEEPVLEWEATGDDRVRLRTPHDHYVADRLVLATGPWMPAELAPLGVRLEVERVVQHWFAPASAAEQLEPGRCPIHLWEDEAGVVFYGFPAVGGEVKCAVHHRGEITTIEAVRREVTAADIERTRGYLARFVPPAAGPHRRSAVCVYTNAPDGDFVLDRHPGCAQVVLASACAGIGFKFAPAVGEALADLAEGRVPSQDVAAFALARLV